MWPSSFDRCSSRGTDNLTGTIGSMQETTLEVEHISTIAGSLGSLGSHSGNDQVYDTDHTDLNSDFDESELKRDLLKDVSTKSNNRNPFSFHSFILSSCIEMEAII
ncbi:RHBDL3.2 family protein [Megaselia abdita]